MTFVIDNPEVDYSQFAPGCVCHFTNSNTAIDKILGEGHLRLGEMKHTNDPYEREVWRISTFGDYDEKDPSSLKSGAVDNYIRSIYSRTRLLCTSADREKSNGVLLHQRSFTNPASWAHYGDLHKGVGLLLDKKQLEADIRSAGKAEVYCDDIQYGYCRHDYEAAMLVNLDGHSDASPNDVSDAHIKDHKTALFFMKDPAWSGESEYRFVAVSKTDTEVFVPIGKSIRGIVLGSQFPKAFNCAALRWAARWNVPCVRIAWIIGSPSIFPVRETEV